MLFVIYSFQAFLLVMTRLAALFAVAPFFSSGVIPARIRFTLAFMISIVIFPMVIGAGFKIPGDTGRYMLLVLQQIAIGLFIGFLVNVIFAAFQLSGQYFAVQIGFGINEVLDPLGQVSVPLVGQLKNLIGLLVFLAMEGHHILVDAIYRSFELAPFMPIDRSAAGTYMEGILYAFSGMFMVALKIALPVVGTIFLVSVSMGILAKVAPQMNIMMLGFPFKILTAFVVLFLITPLIVRIMRVSLERIFNLINQTLLHWPG